MKWSDKKENNVTNNQEQELDNLFDIDSSKVKKSLVRTKIKSIIITTSISIIIIVASYWGFSTWKYHKFYDMRMDIIDEFNNDFTFTNPNRYMGNIKNNSGFLSGNISIGTYKIIENKVVYTGDVGAAYNLKDIRYTGSQGSHGYDWDKDGNNGVSLWHKYSLSHSVKNVNFYNELGQRRMLFFFPFIDYKDLYRNEINYLEEIDDKKIAEIAISFDKYYSVYETEKMMDGLRTTWYWIDTLDEEDKKKLTNEETVCDERQYGDSFIKPIMGEDDDDTIGIKLYNCQGQKIQEPIEEFCRELDSAAKSSRYYEDIKSMLNVSVEYGDEIKVSYDKSKLKIGGVVVTGTIEQLKILQGKPFIKASTLGVTTNKY